jgi:hypothetical protein
MSKAKKTTGEPLFTAKHFKEDCPASLEKLVQAAKDCLAKAKECEEASAKHSNKALDHREQAGKYLVEARKVCTEGGFKALLEKFQLKKTRINELMQVAVGKKTLDEIRAATKARVEKHRASKKIKAAATPSVTPPAVTDEPVPPTTDNAEPMPEATPAQAPVRSLKVIDTALVEFNSLVSRLLQIAKQEPQRFAKTDHPAESLAKLGAFFTELAKLKQSAAAVGLKEVA